MHSEMLVCSAQGKQSVQFLTSVSKHKASSGLVTKPLKAGDAGSVGSRADTSLLASLDVHPAPPSVVVSPGDVWPVGAAGTAAPVPK